MRARSMMQAGRLLFFMLFLVFISHAAEKKNDPNQIGNRNVARGINFYSLEKEIALGRQLASEVEREARLLDDPIVCEYVNRLGQNLVRNSDAHIPFTFKIIESNQPNAFALPGGFVFVNTGLIKMADDEAELAGALAHEIAHVAARHMTRQATREQLANLVTLPLGAIGGWTGYAARKGAALAIPMSFLSFNRRDETEADELGLQYMYAAGYDPAGFVTLFEKLESLERRQPGTIAKVFSTHPPDGVRLEQVQRQIEETLPPRSEYVLTTSEYGEIRARLFALKQQRKDQSSPDAVPVLVRGRRSESDK